MEWLKCGLFSSLYNCALLLTKTVLIVIRHYMRVSTDRQTDRQMLPDTYIPASRSLIEVQLDIGNERLSGCTNVIDMMACNILWKSWLHKTSLECSSYFLLIALRDATQSPGKSPIFRPLKIGGGRGVNPDFAKIETKDSNCRDRTSVRWGHWD